MEALKWQERTREPGRLGAYVALAIFFIWVVLPIAWAATLSLKTAGDIVRIPTSFLFRPTLENYARILHTGEFLQSSATVSSSGFLNPVVAVDRHSGGIHTPAVPLRGRDRLDFWILSTRMAPPVAVLVPYFLLFQKLGLTDTRLAIIIMHLSINLVLVVWLMKSFFAEVPEELSEAALVDGCTYWGAFFRINLPLARAAPRLPPSWR